MTAYKLRMIRFICLLVILSTLIMIAMAGCGKPTGAEAAEPYTPNENKTMRGPIGQQHTITQNGTYHTLNAGAYGGTIEIAEMLKYGDFGLGTFDGLDGELILLDGVYYYADEAGKIRRPEMSITSPFITVCFFNASDSTLLNDPIRLVDLEEQLLRERLDPDKLYAIKITGTFGEINYRSFPKQTPPYIPFTQIGQLERKFQVRDATGTLVGFYFPAWYGEVNAPNFHFHWVSEDKMTGGHVLSGGVGIGRIEICEINQLDIMNPMPPGELLRGNFTPLQESERREMQTEVGAAAGTPGSTPTGSESNSQIEREAAIGIYDRPKMRQSENVPPYDPSATGVGKEQPWMHPQNNQRDAEDAEQNIEMDEAQTNQVPPREPNVQQ